MGRAWGHFLRRFLAIAGIGAVISAGEVLVGENTSGMSWGVLQAIGIAGILTLPTLGLRPAARALVGLLLLGAYQVLLALFWLPTVLRSPHGGLQGSLSWGAMLIMATALSDLWHIRPQGKRLFAPASLSALAFGMALAFLVPVSKNRVSSSYVLISLGASGLLFSSVWLIVERLRFRPALLSWWGANPLLLYVMHYLLLGIFVLPGVPWWHAEAPSWLVASQTAFLLGALSVFAWLLARRGWRISL
jgi:predicted acyltransferase